MSPSHSQADTERADLSRERLELETDPVAERRELTAIYVARGLAPGLAAQVAEQLTAHYALGANARDELGISEALSARPLQAALASAASFAVGAALPLAVAAVAPAQGAIAWVWAPRSCSWACWARLRPAWVAPACWRARGGSPSGGRLRWG